MRQPASPSLSPFSFFFLTHSFFALHRRSTFNDTFLRLAWRSLIRKYIEAYNERIGSHTCGHCVSGCLARFICERHADRPCQLERRVLAVSSVFENMIERPRTPVSICFIDS